MFYIPEGRPSMHEIQKSDGMDGDATCQLRLYSRSVLIQKYSSLVPRWLRFIHGVVDCEDLPLNLSRELLQDQALVAKLKRTITDRMIKWFSDLAKRKPDEYSEFFRDYKMFLVQGILEQQEHQKREDYCKLLRYENSEGKLISLDEYMKNMKEGQDAIPYLFASSREAAEASPYFEAFKKKDMDVLLCYDTYDDLVLLNLQQYKGKPIKSVEQVMASIEDAQ